MRKYWLLFVLILIGIEAHSQILISLLLGDKLNSGNMEFGLEGGANFSSISNMGSNKRIGTFNLGFYFDIKIKDQWSLDTGLLLKSSMGLKDLSEDDLDFLQVDTFNVDGEYKQRLEYFLLPALIKYKFKNNFYLEAGPQFGLMRKAWVEFNSNVDNMESKIKQTNTDMIKRMDVGVVGGAGYRLLKGIGWTIGVKYYYGFIDVYKDRSGTKNNSLFLKLNVPIGLSQESKGEIKEFKDQKKEKKKKRKEEKKNTNNI